MGPPPVPKKAKACNFAYCFSCGGACEEGVGAFSIRGWTLSFLNHIHLQPEACEDSSDPCMVLDGAGESVAGVFQDA